MHQAKVLHWSMVVTLLLTLTVGEWWFLRYARLETVDSVWIFGGAASAAIILAGYRNRYSVGALTSTVAGVTACVAGLEPILALALGVGSFLQAIVTTNIYWGRSKAYRLPRLKSDADITALCLGVLLGVLASLLPYGAALYVLDSGEVAARLVTFFLTSFASITVSESVLSSCYQVTSRASRAELIGIYFLVPATFFLIYVPGGMPELCFALVTLCVWGGGRADMRMMMVICCLISAVSAIAAAFETGPVAFVHGVLSYSLPWTAAIMALFVNACILATMPVSLYVNLTLKQAMDAGAERSTLRDVLRSASNTAIFAVDPRGAVSLFNSGAETLLGYSAGEIVGRSPSRFFTQKDVSHQAAKLGCAADLRNVVESIAARGSLEPIDWELTRKDGSTRNMSMTITKIFAANRVFSGYLFAAHDVTHRADVERALQSALDHERRAFAQMQEIDTFKGNFVATASHELRTPMTNIVGYAELLQDGLDAELPKDLLKDYILRLGHNSTRMITLIEELLTFSRVESSELDLDMEAADLRTLLDSAVRVLEGVISRSGVTLEVELPETPLRVMVDVFHFERMVINLLSNAFKFTMPGGRVRLGVTSSPASVSFAVSDTGIGMSPDAVRQMFTPFFRSEEATKRQIQGTGLGMSIAQGIVRAHSGSIEVQSEPGVGTTCLVTIPRLRETQGAAEVEPEIEAEIEVRRPNSQAS